LNGKLRAECLNLRWFRSPAHAPDGISRRHHHDDTERPHSARGYRSPLEFLSDHRGAVRDPCSTRPEKNQARLGEPADEAVAVLGDGPALTTGRRPEKGNETGSRAVAIRPGM
jgi:hypothetical protein